MLEILPALLFGGGVIAIGIAMLRTHLVKWKDQQASAPIDDDLEYMHFQRQFRRRVQTAIVLVLIGIMLCMATDKIPWGQFPLAFAAYVVLLLGLVFWVMLLGMGDYLSGRAFTQAALGRLRRRQHALEEELQHLRNRDTNPDSY